MLRTSVRGEWVQNFYARLHNYSPSALLTLIIKENEDKRIGHLDRSLVPQLP